MAAVADTYSWIFLIAGGWRNSFSGVVQGIFLHSG